MLDLFKKFTINAASTRWTREPDADHAQVEVEDDEQSNSSDSECQMKTLA